jgi:hypothetical protein
LLAFTLESTSLIWTTRFNSCSRKVYSQCQPFRFLIRSKKNSASPSTCCCQSLMQLIMYCVLLDMNWNMKLHASSLPIKLFSLLWITIREDYPWAPMQEKICNWWIVNVGSSIEPSHQAIVVNLPRFLTLPPSSPQSPLRGPSILSDSSRHSSDSLLVVRDTKHSTILELLC